MKMPRELRLSDEETTDSESEQEHGCFTKRYQEFHHFLPCRSRLMYTAVYPSKKHKQRCTHVHEIKHNMRRDRDILEVLLSSLH